MPAVLITAPCAYTRMEDCRDSAYTQNARGQVATNSTHRFTFGAGPLELPPDDMKFWVDIMNNAKNGKFNVPTAEAEVKAMENLFRKTCYKKKNLKYWYEKKTGFEHWYKKNERKWETSPDEVLFELDFVKSNLFGALSDEAREKWSEEPDNKKIYEYNTSMLDVVRDDNNGTCKCWEEYADWNTRDPEICTYCLNCSFLCCSIGSVPAYKPGLEKVTRLEMGIDDAIEKLLTNPDSVSWKFRDLKQSYDSNDEKYNIHANDTPSCVIASLTLISSFFLLPWCFTVCVTRHKMRVIRNEKPADFDDFCQSFCNPCISSCNLMDVAAQFHDYGIDKERDLVHWHTSDCYLMRKYMNKVRELAKTKATT
jgi:hypothetical protein